MPKTHAIHHTTPHPQYPQSLPPLTGCPSSLIQQDVDRVVDLPQHRQELRVVEEAGVVADVVNKGGQVAQLATVDVDLLLHQVVALRAVCKREKPVIHCCHHHRHHPKCAGGQQYFSCLPSTFPISQATVVAVVTINISNITSHCCHHQHFQYHKPPLSPSTFPKSQTTVVCYCQSHLGLSCVTTCQHQQEHQGDSQMFCAASLCGDHLLSLAGAAISIIFVVTEVLSQQTCVCHDKHMFVTTKHVFCRNKSMPATTKLLSQQNYVCHDKTIVTTKILSQHMFVRTKVLS